MSTNQENTHSLTCMKVAPRLDAQLGSDVFIPRRNSIDSDIRAMDNEVSANGTDESNGAVEGNQANLSEQKNAKSTSDAEPIMQSKGFNAGGKKYEAEVISITNSDNEDNDHADENESANGNEVTDENETADENENKEKLRPGLLERPVVIDGKRQRQSVSRFVSAKFSAKKKAFTNGAGIELSEDPHFLKVVNDRDAEDLKIVHKILFGNPGRKMTIKREIRKFSGFRFNEDSTEFKKKRAIVENLKTKDYQLVMSLFKKICPVEDKRDKSGYAHKLMKFLLAPGLGDSSNQTGTPNRKRLRQIFKDRYADETASEGGSVESENFSEVVSTAFKRSNKEKSSTSPTPKRKRARTISSDDFNEDEPGSEERCVTKPSSYLTPTSLSIRATGRKTSSDDDTYPSGNKAPSRHNTSETAQRKRRTGSNSQSDDEEENESEDQEGKFKDIVFYDPSVEELKSFIKKKIEGKMEEICTKDVLESVQEQWPDLKIGQKKNGEKNFAYLLIKKLVYELAIEVK